MAADINLRSDVIIFFYFVASLILWLERKKITPDTFIEQAVNRPLICIILRLHTLLLIQGCQKGFK